MIAELVKFVNALTTPISDIPIIREARARSERSVALVLTKIRNPSLGFKPQFVKIYDHPNYDNPETQNGLIPIVRKAHQCVNCNLDMAVLSKTK